MLSFLFNLIIMPLVYIFEIVFQASYQIYNKYNSNFHDIYLISIVLVSVAVNVLSFPLYDAADSIQAREREKQNEMKDIIKHIKKTFNGDERFMMLSAYYKIKKYNPLHSIKAALPLLLQIPFFTAAYYFFSNAKCFNGLTFEILPYIHDLSKPDAAFLLFGININILPIIMTIINLISASIYTKDFNLSGKVQPIVLAFIFLVILYNSPSCLVIYWTLNNVFSLLKSIYVKNIKKKALNDKKIVSTNIINDKHPIVIVLLNFAIFTGILIPSSIMQSSPTEFVIDKMGPFKILLYTINVFLGFAVWIYIYYEMSNKKRLIYNISFVLLIYFIINHFIFCNNFGIISENLVYSQGWKGFTRYEKCLDTIIMILCIILFFIMNYKKYDFKYLSVILICSLIGLTVVNIIKIKNGLQLVSNRFVSDVNSVNSYNGKLKLSRNGKNVIFLMLDRSCGVYIPYVLGEKPELMNEFDGFTFYSNCITGGVLTLVGSPGLFGGYEYIPMNSNERSGISIMQKQNEALKLLPTLFSNNGFDCIVSNLPYENLDISSEPSIFENMDNVTKINLANNSLTSFNSNESIIRKLIRNFSIYSIMKIIPVVSKGIIYNNGTYLDNNFYNYSLHSIMFYNAFENMIKKTVLVDVSNNFWMINNEITHNHDNILYPKNKYSPIGDVTNEDFEYGDVFDIYGNKFNGYLPHFSTEMVAYSEISKFLKFLKDNEIYDNTRIIIVSDHGANFSTDLDNEYFFNLSDEINVFVNLYNCVLFYKDFNSHGTLKIDHDFICNFDAPYLAIDGIIKDKINPFTNNEMLPHDLSYNGKIEFCGESKGWNGFKYIDDFAFDKSGIVFEGNDIFDKNNWHYERED